MLHGGSGTGDKDLARCIDHGILKINIATDLMMAASRRIQENPELNYADLSFAGENAFKACLEHYLDVFGSSGRAGDISKGKSYIMVSADQVSAQI